MLVGSCQCKNCGGFVIWNLRAWKFYLETWTAGYCLGCGLTRMMEIIDYQIAEEEA